MTAPYQTHRRRLLGVPDGTPLCAECKQPHQRKGQRLCRTCHNAYQRQWKADQAKMARAYRRGFHGKQTVSSPQTFIVAVEKYGEAKYRATSPQMARSLAWRSFRNVSENLSYVEFVKISTVRRAAERAA